MIGEFSATASGRLVGADVIEFSDPARLVQLPAVTVIMNTFDHAPYIAQAIEGVLAQVAEFGIELIVSEDCSHDATRSVALDFQRRHPQVVRVVTGPANVGGPRNFRRAVAQARGRYIALCEGDDYWVDSTKLSRQVAMLEGDPRLGAVHTEFSHLIYMSGRWRRLERFQSRWRKNVPSGDVLDELIRGNFIQTCTLAVRADLVRTYLRHPLSTRGNPVGDWPLCLFVAANAAIAYIDSPTAVYRKVPGSATNRGATVDIERARLSMQMIEAFGREFGKPEALILESFARAHEHIVILSLVHGLPDDFASSLEWLRSYAPGRFGALRWNLASLLVASPVLGPGLAHALQTKRFVRELIDYRD
jgi:glycosyltransferase involved in cell wall biosynthesis